MLNEQLIAGLKESFIAEYYSMLYLFQCGHAIKGLHEYELYHDFFHEGYKSEFKHMHTIANWLAGYDVEVKFSSVDVPLKTELVDMLTHLYEVENWAIERYTRLTKLAEELDNLALSNVFQALCQDEDEDRQELIKRFGKELGEVNDV